MKTGLPVGIKSAVGKLEMWEELAEKMAQSGKGPDFITIDGGEGGTGAAPPAFADHMSLPFTFAFSKVYQIFKNIIFLKKLYLSPRVNWASLPMPLWPLLWVPTSSMWPVKPCFP